MKIDTVNLFPTELYKIYINPGSYDKTELLDTIQNNYKKDPKRNNFDKSNFHTYYHDWNNDEFEKLNLSSIGAVYQNLFHLFVEQLPFKNLTYRWKVVSLTVYDKDQYMHVHDHFSDYIFYACVHYLKKSKTHSPLSFCNPLVMGQYKNYYINSISQNIINDDPRSSCYFGQWNQQVEEDYMYIFPSYLKHEVLPSESNSSDLRIALVTNLFFLPEDKYSEWAEHFE